MDSETEKPLLAVIHAANCLLGGSVCFEGNIKDHGLLLRTQAVPGWAWIPSILKASLPVSGSPTVAVALGYSKL